MEKDMRQPKFRDIVGFLLLVVVLVFAACARQASPTGGPKDEDPPVPVKSKPLNYSTNFDDDRIIVQFDEYVTLKNVTQELLISPPLPEKPEVKLKGKNVVVLLNNELEDSTTYNVNFYNSIVDLNEGNLLKNFQFEMSTGDEFDSLYVGGVMQKAYDLTSEPALKVLLYDQWHDTIPRTTLPNYVAKTDENGAFVVANLRDKPYHVIGLKDMNNNHLFDLPNEGIAFLDSTLRPGYEQVELTDTFRIIEMVSADLADTTFRDSTSKRIEWVSTISNIRLFMFVEDSEPQYLSNTYRDEDKLVVFAFNRELSDSFFIEPVMDTAYAEQWFVQETPTTPDSVVYWLTDSVMYKRDSLFFETHYTMLDSNMEYYTQIDTLLLRFKKKEVSKKEKRKAAKKGGKNKGLNLGFLGGADKEEEEEVVIPSELKFTHNIGKALDLNKKLELTTKYPIASWDDSRIELYKVVDDTLFYPHKYSLTKDTAYLRKFFLDFEKDEDEKFDLLIPAGSFTDIYGNINDTLNYQFKSQELSYYSTIYLNIKNAKQNAVVQLLDGKEKLLRELEIEGDTTLVYEYVHPAKVMFKLFYDGNRNGKWDTGKLSDRLQPEQVFYFIEAPELKGNMDFEWDWDLYPVLENAIQGEKYIIDQQDHDHDHHDHQNHNH